MFPAAHGNLFSGSLVIVVVCYKALQLATITEDLNCT